MESKKLVAIVMAVILVLTMVGCAQAQADRVSENISKEADNFNVLRRISVINMRTDKPIFELIGAFSISNNSNNELVITVETGPNEYKKHFVYLNNWTMYVVEDLCGSSVSKYKYEINFLPEMIVPFTLTTND